jgi:hypothetical protein
MPLRITQSLLQIHDFWKKESNTFDVSGLRESIVLNMLVF